MGFVGGVRNKPLLKQSLKAFLKASKALFKSTGRDNTFQLTRAHRGKQFLLEQYGVKMHLPAVVAEVCIDAGVNKTLNSMMLTLRSIRQGTHKGKIKSSAAALPRVEPWLHIISNTPTPILNILRDRCNRRLDSIDHQGERGDGRDLRAQIFLLECPQCGSSRDCSKVRLYSTVARGLTCSKCKRSTTSTKWQCEHGTPWTKCPLHTETGFRCGPLSLNMHKATLGRRNTCSLRPPKGIRLRLTGSASLGNIRVSI